MPVPMTRRRGPLAPARLAAGALLAYPLLAGAGCRSVPDARAMPAATAPAMAMAAATTAKTPPAVTAIVNANVLPMTGETVLRDHTVVVAGGKITSVAPSRSAAPPADATVIDAAGGWLLPGLADMHVHVGMEVPGVPDAAPLDPAHDMAAYLAHGITTIRNMRGGPADLELRERVAVGAVLGPRYVTAGPSLHATGPAELGPRVATPEEAEAEARAQATAGYDLIKIHGNLPLETFRRAVEAAAAAGLAAAGHAQTKLEPAASASLTSLEHAEEIAKLLGPERRLADLPELRDALLANGTFVTPTLGAFDMIHRYLDDTELDALMARPETALVSTYWLELTRPGKNYYRQAFGPEFAARHDPLEAQSRRLFELTGELHHAGVPLLAGTDAIGLMVPGLGLHEELAHLVAAGLTPYAALRSATVVPATLLGVASERGTLEPGRDADLLLLAADPLAAIANTRAIRGVMIRGRWLDRAALDALLAARAAAVAATRPPDASPPPG